MCRDDDPWRFVATEVPLAADDETARSAVGETQIAETRNRANGSTTLAPPETLAES
jgi:hypothetical protein